MLNTVLLVLLTGATLTLGGILLLALLIVRRKVREVENAFRAFVSAPDSQTPSPLAQSVDAAAQLAGRAVIAQFKTTLMGMNSGAVRAEQAAGRQAALDKFPWLGILNQMSPALTKTLARNPQLLNLAGSLLAKGGNGASPVSTPASRTSAPKFDL